MNRGVHKKFDSKEQGICIYLLHFLCFCAIIYKHGKKALKSEVAENLKQVEQGIPMELYPI